MAKSLGELYVRLSARTAGFAESLGKAADEGAKRVAEAADAIEGKASKMAAALGDISDGFLAVGGVAAAAFAGAAGYSEPVTEALEKLKGTTATLAVEIGEALLPVLRDTTQFIAGLVSAWRSLDDGTKANLVSVVRWAAVIGPALFGLTRGIIIAKGFFEAFVVAGPILGAAVKALTAFSASALTAQVSLTGVAATAATSAGGVLASAGAMAAGFAAALWPIALVAAAIGALVLLAGTLYKAWNDSGNGFADTMRGLANTAMATAKNVGLFFADMWGDLTDYITKAAGFMLEAFAAQVRGLAMLARPLASVIGSSTLNAALDTMSAVTGASMAKDLMDGAKAAGQAYVDAIVKPVWDLQMTGLARAKEGVGYAVDGAKDMLKAVWSEVSALMPDFSGKGVGASESIEAGNKRFAEFEKRLAAMQSYADQQVAREAEGSAANDERNAAQSFAAMAAEDAFAKEMAELQASEMASNAEEMRQAVIADADAAVVSWRGMYEDAQRAAEEMQAAQDAFTSKIANRAGNATGLAESASMGMAMGGPMGAIGAVGLDLLTQSETFKGVIESVNGVLQVVADFLGQLLTPLQPLIAALGLLVTSVLPALTPLFEIVATVLEPLVPPLMMLGQVIGALLPIFMMLNPALKALELGFKLIEPAMKGLFEVLRFIGVVILTVVKALADAWNAVVNLVNSFIEKAKKAYSMAFGAAFGDLMAGGSVKPIDTSGIQENIDELKDATWGGALDAAGNAVDRFGKTVSETAESLSNVPALFKLALRRGQSQNADRGDAGPDPFGEGGRGYPPGKGDAPVMGGGLSGGKKGVTVNASPARTSNGDGTWTLTEGMGAGARVGDSITMNLFGNDMDELVGEAERFINRRSTVDVQRDGAASREKFQAA